MCTISSVHRVPLNHDLSVDCDHCDVNVQQQSRGGGESGRPSYLGSVQKWEWRSDWCPFWPANQHHCWQASGRLQCSAGDSKQHSVCVCECECACMCFYVCVSMFCLFWFFCFVLCMRVCVCVHCMPVCVSVLQTHSVWDWERERMHVYYEYVCISFVQGGGGGLVWVDGWIDRN